MFKKLESSFNNGVVDNINIEKVQSKPSGNNEYREPLPLPMSSRFNQGLQKVENAVDVSIKSDDQTYITKMPNNIPNENGN